MSFQEQHPSKKHRSWLLSLAIHAAFFAVLIFAQADTKQPALELEIMPVELLDVSSPPPPVPAPVSPVPEPVPEPPVPEPVPEPPAPEPAPPPPEPVPEPPPPEPPKPKPVEQPPKEPPKPKPKTKTLAERLAEAKKDTKTVTPPKQPPRSNRNQQDAAKALADRLKASSQRISSSIPQSVRISSEVAPAGVAPSQYNQYAEYLTRCVQPIVQQLWEELGPTGLSGNPRVPVLTFTVTPAGNITVCMVSGKSDNAAMNSAAQRMSERLRQKRLPAFSQVGLSTISNAPLTFKFNLVCQQQQ